jgi:hypothetical protein
METVIGQWLSLMLATTIAIALFIWFTIATNPNW